MATDGGKGGVEEGEEEDIGYLKAGVALRLKWRARGWVAKKARRQAR